MRIEVIGGGPGGLYFGILMRQAFPTAEIAIRERNRPDDTFGFGVVFSDETLGFLDEADPASAAEIRARFRNWEEIRTWYRGVWTTSTGHGFSALSRVTLLEILQRRALAVGCDLRFEAEVREVEPLLESADLVVACDGVNSFVRDRFAESFKPSVSMGSCRFSWLGSDWPIEAFTFLFVESEHGLFQVHAYPFDGDRATFIVETHDEAWRAAGLDGAGEEETVPTCERLFAEHLDGHRLFANRSIWRQFPTVRCERWRHRNLVLIGDAAHTAHFSIGSGTKLAMEDAIELVAAFGREGTDDVPRALAAYEEARRLDVLKLQRAAKISRRWFENSRRYLGQEPTLFTFNLMTRSKRITYENLRERDPRLVSAVDRAFRVGWDTGFNFPWVERPATGSDRLGDTAGENGSQLRGGEPELTLEPPASPRHDAVSSEGRPEDGTGLRIDVEAGARPDSAEGLSLSLTESSSDTVDGTTSAGIAPPPVFTPFRLRGLELRNRIVVSPMCQYSAVDGTPNDWHLVHLGARALGGAGLVIAEMTDVTPDGRITHGCTGMYAEEHVAAWRRIVDFVHQRSAAPIGLQLAHAGRKGSAFHEWTFEDRPLRPEEGAWETLAPSAVSYGPSWPSPRAMGRPDMDRVRDAFVRATRRADEAGFDLLELHCAHGYLLSSFLSPLANFRDDAYGGPLENRMRYPLEVFAAMREAWPERKPMSVRVSASDWFEEEARGTTIAETVAFARELAALGCDLIDVSSAGNVPESAPEFGRMYQVPFAEQVRYEAGLPVMAVGAIQGVDHANTVIAAGRADLAAMARPHLFDPSLTLHAAAEAGVEVDWPPQYWMGRPRGPR